MAASDVGQDRVGLLNGAGGGAPGTEEPEGATMTLIEHLDELRRRLFYCVIAVAVGSILSFIFWEHILGFLLTPLPYAVRGVEAARQITYVNGSPHLVVHGVGEAFTVALKLSIAMGFVVAAPVTLYQVWAFISPGLTRRERRYATPFTVLGALLFVIGLGVGFVVLRYPVDWLLTFGQDRFITLLDADSYLTFVAYFLLAFGVVFELPLVLTFLSLVGIVNSRLLRQRRKYAWFGLWVLSCFITPGADPYSPVIIGVATTALYELSILLMRLLGR
jgi:sec-independent protein translocase protein TatC